MDYLELRKQLGLSQVKMAQRLGISLNTWIGWEKKVSKPNLDNYLKIQELIKDLPFEVEVK